MSLNGELQPGMIGAFYGRHSTDKQDMDAQKSSAKSFVKKYGCVIGWFYEDENVSAVKKKKEDRPFLNTLLSDAKIGKFDFIVISSHDRFARSPMEHQEIRKELKECNVPVFISTTDERYDIGDLLSQIIKDGVSKLEADNTRLRTKNTLESFVKNGKWTGGKVPFGYVYVTMAAKEDTKTSKNSKFELIEEKVEIIRLIFDLYQKDNGFQAIANKLNDKYEVTIWNKNKIKAILTNPFYAGYLSINRKKSQSHSSLEDNTDLWTIQKCDTIPPAITKEVWDNCWRIYQQKKTKSVGDKEKKRINGKFYSTSYFFRGLIACKQCKMLLSCKNQETKSSRGNQYGSRIYFCSNCKLRIEADTLHSMVKRIGIDITSNGYDDLVMKIAKDYSIEQAIIDKKIKLTEESIDLLVKKIKLLDKELNNLILHNNKDNKNLIKVLSLAKNEFDQEKNNKETELINVKKQSEAIAFLLKNQDLWKHWVDELFLGDLDKFNTEDLRRFLLYYVNHLIIDEQGNIELETKHFPEPLYYKIDL